MPYHVNMFADEQNCVLIKHFRPNFINQLVKPFLMKEIKIFIQLKISKVT